jgi:hypothetical protein
MQLPDQINDDLTEILGMMLFTTAPIAHSMQRSGVAIPHKVEAEQANVLFKLLSIYAEHGDQWRTHAGEWLKTLVDADKAKGAKDARPTMP